MIAHLTGTILDVRLGHIVLDVHGVGYLVAVRATVDFAVGATASLHTHLAVRENALDLYGFVHERERALFEILIKLPKVGPKTALQILTQADVSLIEKAVADQDPVYLSKMSGIGKKTAEKIVAELKDVLSSESDFAQGTHHTRDTDIVDALIALGYTQKDARDVVQQISPDVSDTNERIKQALRMLGGR